MASLSRSSPGPHRADTGGALGATAAAPARLAFVVPAHDEAAGLGATLDALQAAARELLGAAPFEVVVVDDASTDGTGDVARRCGAAVVRSERRQIAAARNAGIAATSAPVLVFVDADTLVNPDSLREALQALDAGALGGGAMVRFDGPVPRFARIALELVVLLLRAHNFSCGCFFFCRREALLAVGGWDEAFFAGEELELAKALARLGRQRGIPARRGFRIVRTRVVTSGRKVRTHSARELIGLLLRLVRRGRRGLQSRRGLEFWYERRSAQT